MRSFHPGLVSDELLRDVLVFLPWIHSWRRNTRVEQALTHPILTFGAVSGALVLWHKRAVAPENAVRYLLCSSSTALKV